MRTRVVRPREQIGRVRVVLGSCSAESTSEGGERRMGVGGVTFSLHTYHAVSWRAKQLGGGPCWRATSTKKRWVGGEGGCERT
jgi:hypothetical protein